MSSNPDQKLITGGKLARKKLPPTPQEELASALVRVRPDRNLEKWAIWQPAHSQNKKTRTFSRTITTKDGKERVQQVKVYYVDEVGTLTTEDQKVFYALVKIWEDWGKAKEITYFSLQQLGRVLKKKWGSYAIETIVQSLTRLRTIGIVWIDSYFDNVQKTTKSHNSALIPFTILSSLKIISRKQDGHITTASGYFRFDDDILSNLQSNYTKPVMFDVVINLKSEIAQILYTYLDLIIADKTIYERRTKELFEDLGLEGSAYKNASNRKQKLAPALKELQGLPFTTGRILSATLEPTADKKDLKLVIRKGKMIEPLKVNHFQEDESALPQAITALPETGGIDDETILEHPKNHELHRQTKELVTYFYDQFHTGKDYEITWKAKNHAISLIAHYGFEKAKYIVDYARQKAPETGFDIQTFGGVMQYTSRALDDYERQRLAKERAVETRRHQEAQALRESEEDRRREEKKAQARAYLDSLPEEEYETLFANYAKEQRQRFGYLNRIPEESATSQIKMMLIREVVKQLESESPTAQSPETQKTAQGEPQTPDTMSDSTPDQIAH